MAANEFHFRSRIEYLRAVSALQQGDYIKGLLRYTLVAIIVFCAYISALYILVKYAEWSPNLATMISYFSCSILSLGAHAAFTFRVGQFGFYDVVHYMLAGIVGAVIARGLMALLHGYFGLPIIFPAVVSCVLAPLIGFCALNFLIFGRTALDAQEKSR
jgi:putative flippase GtrA